MSLRRLLLLIGTTILVAAVPNVVTPSAQAATTVPAYDHIVMVMFENKAYSQITSSSAPYFTSLAAQGAKFTQSYAITHPSQPNYLAYFSGSTQGSTNDNCPLTLSGVNLASQLIGAGETFKGYSESMPSNGYTGCSSGTYRRKHNSWVDFTNVPSSSNLTYAGFPTDFTTLPSVAFVTPNMCNDMHDCSIGTGNTWLQSHLDAYAQWAKTHNSLLIVTFDEDNSSSMNHIYTAFVGAHVVVGSYSDVVNHCNMLRTIEAAFGLPGINNAAGLSPILNVFS